MNTYRVPTQQHFYPHLFWKNAEKLSIHTSLASLVRDRSHHRSRKMVLFSLLVLSSSQLDKLVLGHNAPVFNIFFEKTVKNIKELDTSFMDVLNWGLVVFVFIKQKSGYLLCFTQYAKIWFSFTQPSGQLQGANWNLLTYRP